MAPKRPSRLVGILLVAAVLLTVVISQIGPSASAAACPPGNGYILVGHYGCRRPAPNCSSDQSGADLWYNATLNKFAVCPFCCWN